MSLKVKEPSLIEPARITYTLKAPARVLYRVRTLREGTGEMRCVLGASPDLARGG